MVKSDLNTREKIHQVLSRFDQKDIDFNEAENSLIDVLMKESDEIVENIEENKVDRVRDWDEFSSYMRKYIQDKTVLKYGQKSSGMDLMSVTKPWVCIWNIFKYILRLWNNSGKRYDIEKIIHYAQMSVTLSKGDLTKCGVRESENPNKKFWR